MKGLSFSESELTSGEYPLVAIVGRPNVGKSTLFNRLIGKRKAITDPTPGVTRDPVYERYELDDIPVVLVDTGGYKPDMEGLDYLVVDKSLEILQSADMVILVMDVEEVLAEDEELIEKLRPFSKKTLLAVNKVDNGIREESVWNYHAFGFNKVIPISAAHGSNMSEFIEECGFFLRSVANAKVANAIAKGGFSDFFDPDKATIRLSILGQPNTGKSTLSNILTGEGRSIVSDIAGTTRDIIEGGFTWKDRQFTITDTAGIRRKKRVGENIEYYSVNRAIASIKECDIVLLMVDADKGLAEQDKKIANLVIKEGRGVVLVMNKWDLLEDIANQEEAVRDRIRFLFPILGFAPIVPLSALNEEGVPHLLNVVENVYRQLTKRLDTNVLNKALQDWLYDHQPPSAAGIKYKPKYLTQTAINPPRFLLFVNKYKGFPDEWVQYLKNRLRKDMGFHSVPVEVTLKESEGGNKEKTASTFTKGQRGSSSTSKKKVDSNPFKKPKPKPKWETKFGSRSSAGSVRSSQKAADKNTRNGGRAVAKAKPNKPNSRKKAK